MQRPVLIVGNDGGTNIGASLLREARAAGLPADLMDMRAAFDAPAVVAKVNWWLRDRRPTHLRRFSASVVKRWREAPPRLVLATGLAPLDAEALDDARSRGVHTAVFLTDDPWNPAFRSAWFLAALPLYTRVFTPRRANVDDLRRHGCADVSYLPFGFDPVLFYPDPPPGESWDRYASDVFFAGGADEDRRPYLAALLDAGFNVALYGDYWDRFAETRHVTRGHGTPRDLRRGIASAKVCLCLVRHGNRDGHAMRSMEVPAAGGCCLVERTDEHQEIFGADGDAVLYFDGLGDVVERVRQLVADEPLRRRLADRAHTRIMEGGHTYRHRLFQLIEGTAA